MVVENACMHIRAQVQLSVTSQQMSHPHSWLAMVFWVVFGMNVGRE